MDGMGWNRVWGNYELQASGDPDNGPRSDSRVANVLVGEKCPKLCLKKGHFFILPYNLNFYQLWQRPTVWNVFQHFEAKRYFLKKAQKFVIFGQPGNPDGPPLKILRSRPVSVCVCVCVGVCVDSFKPAAGETTHALSHSSLSSFSHCSGSLALSAPSWKGLQSSGQLWEKFEKITTVR